MQKLTRNSFEKGINTDIDQTKLPPSVYTDAHNVELVGDGDFFALRNVKGTTLEDDILTGNNVEVIGVFDNVYKIGGSDKKCLTIFTMEDPVLSAQAATFNVTGQPATFTTTAKIIVVSPLSYVLTGQPATLKTNKIVAESGSFSLTGPSVNLTPVFLVNIELVVSTLYGSRFNVEFSGTNETKTINRTNSGTTTSTIKLSSSIAAKVTKGASGSGVTADLTSIEWFKNGTSQNVDSLGTGVVVNNTYTYTSVAQGNTLRVEVIEG